MKNWDQWQQYLLSLHPKAMDLSLVRVGEVARKLNLVHWSVPVITVAGTNGKGSTCALLQATLQAHGFRVGSFTSPHLYHYTERIKINDCAIDIATCMEIFALLDLARADTSLSYFEFTLITALLYFKQAAVDYVILEVGLGGRLDASNVVHNNLSIVTSIALDHCHILGNSLAEIAREKAGIFKAGELAIWGDLAPMPPDLVQKIQAMNLKVYCRDLDFQVKKGPELWSMTSQLGLMEDLAYPNIPLQNAATAMMAILLILPNYNQQTLQTVLKNLKVPGRFETMHYAKIQCPMVFDVGHNPAAAQWVAQQLELVYPHRRKTYLIFGVFKDKDWRGMLAYLRPIVDELALVPLQVPRALSHAEQVIWAKSEPKARAWPNLFNALCDLQVKVQSNDIILIFGSFITVSETITMLKSKFNQT